MQGRAAVIHVLMGTESVPLLQRRWWFWLELLCSMHNRRCFPCGFLYTNTSVHTVDMQRRHVGRGHVCMTGSLRECIGCTCGTITPREAPRGLSCGGRLACTAHQTDDLRECA